MRVSAVIPVFNRQQLGMRAVRSALAQKHPLIEVIAVDDGSAEPFTPDQDVSGDARLRVIRLAQNSGADWRQCRRLLQCAPISRSAPPAP